jgi:uncharacterized protein
MRERDGYIPGVPCWVDTTQPDPEAALAFYEGVFGWKFENVLPPGAPGSYHIARIAGGDVAAVSSQPDGASAGAAWNTYIWVDSADEAAERAWQAGGRVLVEPFDISESGRSAVIADPEGATFRVWQPGAHRGARIVNEPGTLNFNGLATRDRESAESFYRSVFGWEVLDLGAGGTMWMLPGYGEFLERSEPRLRERQAEAGAPEGFADVVATLEAIAEDQPDLAPHWSVTFAVADADAAAERAVELGGQVLAGPFDAPWVRMAVLADPQGASFVASKFVPENRVLARAGEVAAKAA